jgi:N-acetylglucosaminyldiphosphoundecaprenol N-acetyl-beta-D-mannosaminyltransferase
MLNKAFAVEFVTPALQDDLSRDVYGLFGIPIDAEDRVSVLRKIAIAADAGTRFLISTPNVNFLIQSQRDAAFRESLLQSDHCCPDGMPIVWISRLLGLRITERVSGSDLFETLRSEEPSSRPLKVFLFGGGEGVAETVCGLLNARRSGICCVGVLNPGFGTVEAMSESAIIERVNRSGADLLAVFLSATKAQFWLHHNHDRLSIPVRGQFGATINYQAGIVRRAPPLFQRLGLEWLWRIKEEPYLWRRYWTDGLSLMRLVLTRVLPIAIDLAWQRRLDNDLSLSKRKEADLTIVGLVGFATEKHVTKCIAFFRSILIEGGDIVIDLSQTRAIDPRFLGLLLMLRKELKKGRNKLTFTDVSASARRNFRLNGFEFLLHS